MADRFAARVGHVDNAEGFEEFQLLRPADGREQWLVYTRWRDRESFEAWVGSQAFGEGHARPEGPGGPVASTSTLWAFSVEQRAAANA